MKRFFCLLACLLFLACAVGCAGTAVPPKKLTVTATLFPQYDFARQIAGDKADVKLLLPPGMESHNYEPSVSDIAAIHNSDLFLYTGPAMEAWAETVIESLNGTVTVVDLSKNIEPLAHEHGEEDEHEHEHEHEVDPHIWTDPCNACIMADQITEALCSADPANAPLYRVNAQSYKAELMRLDKAFEQISQTAQTHTLCHGGRFSMNYFAHRYGFAFHAAFDSCDAQAEPSVAKVASLIKTVKQEKLQGVFCEELVAPTVAEVIAHETNVPVYTLHTCHNVSKQELQRGETYCSLMWQNVKNLSAVTGGTYDT